MRNKYASIALVILSGCAAKPDPQPVIQSMPPPVGVLSEEALYSHAAFLAGDSLYGRRAGSIYELQAAEYIRDRLASSGLQPAVEGYLQPFSFIADIEMEDGNGMTADGSVKANFEPDADFRPLGFSSNGLVAGDLVFVGYGISAEEPKFDDYAGLAVTNKVVMALRYSPDGTNPHGAFGKYSKARYKAHTAREKGAVAVLLVAGPEENETDNLMTLRYDRGGDAGIPVVNITRATADRLLAPAGLNVADLQREINASRLPLSVGIKGVKVRLSVKLKSIEAESHNVLAALPGAGSLADEWVVLGAHYDHLGWGGEGSGSLATGEAAIHNGADDNASGISTLLEVARQLAAELPAEANRRSIMFQAFGAEELGLLGSAYVTKNSPVPMDHVAAMLNMDMVGRLSTGKLVVGGAATSPLWKELVTSHNSAGIDLGFNDEGFGSSDHQSYYLADKPVLFFFTGQHQQYHRPGDDVALLDLAGMSQIGMLVSRLITDLATRSEAPRFVKAESSRPSMRGGFPVVMGTIPDYTWDGAGMRLSGARVGSPAEKGGLQAGDIIVGFGDTEVKNIYDYMYALQAAKAGKAIKVTVLREGQEVVLEVVPERGRD